MARKTSNPRPRRSTAPSVPLNARSVFLASLGAVIRGRREALRLATEAASVRVRLRAGAEAAASTARSEAGKLVREARRIGARFGLVAANKPTRRAPARKSPTRRRA